MKYRLKKDLPFAKAGEIVDVNVDTDIWTIRPLSAVIDCPLCDIPEDVRDEWVEEVKPREFWVELKQDSYGNWKVNDASENKDWLHEENTLYKSIKVREVLDETE